MITPTQTQPARPRNAEPARATTARVVALLLGCLTAVTLVAVAALTRVPVSSDAPSPATSRAAVARFVEAANAAVATRDAAAFDGVLADGFVLHAEQLGIGSDRAALVCYLTGIGGTFPHAAFAQEEVTADGSLVVLRYTLRGQASGAVAGVPVARPQMAEENVAVVRLTGRYVAELWGFVSMPAVEPMVSVGVHAPSAGSVVGAARMTYAPGVKDPTRVLPGSLVVSVERGSLRAAVDGPAAVVRLGRSEPEPLASGGGGTAVDLRPGETLVVPAYTWHALRNDGAAPAVAFVVAVLPMAAATWSPMNPSKSVVGPTTMPWPAAPVPGVTVEPIAGGNAPELPAGELRVALARVRLAAGTGLTMHADAWAAIAIAESGSLRLATGVSEAPVLRSGDGALLTPGERERSDAPAGEVHATNDGTDASTLILVGVVATDR